MEEKEKKLNSNLDMRLYKQTKRFLLLLAMLSAESFADAQIKVEASETVELMSIISRTAGFPEYCMDNGGQYTSDTETWFSAYGQHPTVAYVKELRKNCGISYDAVMSMAVHLNTDGQKVSFTGEKSDLGKRWQKVEIDTFLVRLNQFYSDTRFHEFYKQHQTFYESVLQAYEENVMKYFHQDWYPQFYGTEPTEQFRIIIGFTNGGGNYGTNRQMIGQPKEIFAICGYYTDETMNSPFENGMDYASTLIHEFNHSFVNSLYDANAVLLDSIGKTLLGRHYRGMSSQAYGDAATVINESVVRAAVIIYMQENGFAYDQVKKEMCAQVGRDFLWMPELVTTLRYYSKHRNRYKTLDNYYPEIAKCLKKYLKEEMKRIEKSL